MNYATQYHIGNYSNTRTETPTAIVPPVERVCPLDAKTKGRKSSAKGQTAVRTHNHAANGFLRTSFLPRLEETETIQACKETAKTERDFYKSLSNLVEHYSIETMNTKDFKFPYNIALGMWDIETKLKRTNANWENFKLIQDSKKTYFISEERYDTHTTLYYIPVLPLFQMLHNPKHKKNAQLLISICSYLYHIAEIPYYRYENSYLYWLYEMYKDWIEDDYETEETDPYKSELNKAELIGDIIEQKLYNRANLTVFEQRLSHFKSRDTFDHECWQIACNAFALYTEYPTENIFRNAPMPEQDPYREDYENEVIGMEKYISFIADTKGWLYENLTDSINNEFNECGTIEEPTISNTFDGNEINATNLDFESRIFKLLDDLSYLLYNYKTTT